MINAQVLGKSFEIIQTDDGFLVNGNKIKWDFEKVNEGYFHILLGNRSLTAEVVSADYQTKTFHIKINGKIYPVIVKDRFDILLEKMGMNAPTAGRVNTIKAPMPGLIVDLRVKEGDTVKAGDILLILEAMKMENIIKSSGEGIVKSIKAKKGESVEKNQVLIEF